MKRSEVMGGLDAAVLEAYYAALLREGGYSARCVMELPDDLIGKRVLDLACRRGKGVFKIADRVGPQGIVLGVDPSPAFVDEARMAFAQAACHADQDARCTRVSFACGCFENLRAAGVEDASFDVVVVNSVLNLAWDLDAALHEIVRALAAGGTLCHAGLFAENSLPSNVARPLAAKGNVFGAALTQDAFKSAVLKAGFTSCEFTKVESLVPAGIDADVTLVSASFVSAVVLARTVS